MASLNLMRNLLNCVNDFRSTAIGHGQCEVVTVVRRRRLLNHSDDLLNALWEEVGSTDYFNLNPVDANSFIRQEPL